MHMSVSQNDMSSSRVHCGVGEDQSPDVAPRVGDTQIKTVEGWIGDASPSSPLVGLA